MNACCADPLIRYSDGWVCVRCHPERLAACPVCKQSPPFGPDHVHSGLEVLGGVQ